MIEVLNDVASNVAGFKARGEVTKHDYETVVVPQVESKLASAGKIHFLLYLDTDVSNYTAGAWLEDGLIGLKHFTKWHKMAIVSDQEGVRKFTDLFSFIAPGEAKGFGKDEYEAAKTWVAS